LFGGDGFNQTSDRLRRFSLAVNGASAAGVNGVEVFDPGDFRSHDAEELDAARGWAVKDALIVYSDIAVQFLEFYKWSSPREFCAQSNRSPIIAPGAVSLRVQAPPN
jgi:hypothetical protein